MIDYLYQTTDINLFLILNCILIGISIIALLFIKYFVPLHLRYQENAVIGCTSALIIVIYAVLAGFATLYLINNNTKAADAMQSEANSVANLYRDAQVLSKPLSTHARENIKRYIAQVVNVEWPLMNQGQVVTNEGDVIIQQMALDLVHYNTNNALETEIIADMLEQMNTLNIARHVRIQSSYTFLSPAIWVAIIIGTLLSLFVSYLFGINFYLHIFVVIAAALMTASVMFLLISLDAPYQGIYNVGPTVLLDVQTFINGQPQGNS